MTEATTILQALNNIHQAMVMCCSGATLDEEPSTNTPDADYKCKAAHTLYGEIGTFFGDMAGTLGAQLSRAGNRLWNFQLISMWLNTLTFQAVLNVPGTIVREIFQWWWYFSEADFNHFTDFQTGWYSRFDTVIGDLYAADTPIEAKAVIEMHTSQILGGLVMPDETRNVILDLVTGLMSYSFINRLFDVDPAINALPEMSCTWS